MFVLYASFSLDVLSFCFIHVAKRGLSFPGFNEDLKVLQGGGQYIVTKKNHGTKYEVTLREKLPYPPSLLFIAFPKAFETLLQMFLTAL